MFGICGVGGVVFSNAAVFEADFSLAEICLEHLEEKWGSRSSAGHLPNLGSIYALIVRYNPFRGDVLVIPVVV